MIINIEYCMRNPETPKTSNQKTAVKFMTALGKYDRKTLESLSTRESRYWQMGYNTPYSGFQNMMEVINNCTRVFPQLPDGVEFEFLTFTEEGNKVTIEAESQGELAKGEEYRNQHHTAIYFDDKGKVLEYKDYLDTLNIYEALFNGEVKKKTSVHKKDKSLRLTSIPKLIRYLQIKQYRKSISNYKKTIKESASANEKNTVTALAFIEAIGNQDLLTLASLYSLKGTFWQIGNKLVLSGEHTQVETANFVPRIYKRLPYGMKFDNSSIVASNNRVAVESVSHAELYNGNTYKNQYNFMFYFDEKGKVIKFKEYWGTHHAYDMLFEKETDLA